LLIDCFMGFDEIPLAEFRINYLSSVVTHTFILESNITHSGDEKPLFFKSWYSRLDDEARKTVTVLEITFEDKTLDHSWEREIASREKLLEIANKRFPGSRILLSDLDEIPSIAQINEFLSLRGNFRYNCKTSYRRANWFLGGRHDDWNYGVLSSDPCSLGANAGRFRKWPVIKTADPGLHLSYLGTSPERLKFKFNSFAHTEYRHLNFDFERLLEICDDYLIDHLGRIRSKTFGLLRSEKPDQLRSSILTLVKETHPEWIGGQGKRSLLLRLFISAAISNVLRNSASTPQRVLWLNEAFSKDPGIKRIKARYVLLLLSGLELIISIVWNIRRIFQEKKVK
jgi:Glycosyltransferase family 17